MAFIDHARNREKGAGCKAVGEHLEDCPLQCGETPRRHAEDDEAHVADAGVGNQPLHVRLAVGQDGAVDDPDDADHRDRAGEARRGFGKQRHGEANQAVPPGLQQQSGEEHAACGRRLRVSIGEPAMQRKDRKLDGKGDKETEKQPPCRLQGYAGSEQGEVIGGECAADLSVCIVQADDCHQQQQPGCHGEDHELHSRADAVLVPPDADEEIHRHQHQLPEEVEEEQIEGEKDTHDPSQGRENAEVVQSRGVIDLAPRHQHGDAAEKAGQDDEQEVQAVESKVILDAQTGYPRQSLLEEWVRRDAQVVCRSEPQRQRKGQRQQRGDQRRPTRSPLAHPTDEPGDNTAGKRDEDQSAQNHRRHPVTSTARRRVGESRR